MNKLVMEEQVQKGFLFEYSKGTPFESKKSSITLFILLVFLAIPLGTLSFISVYPDSSFLLILACQLLAFLVEGIGYTLLLYRNASASNNSMEGRWLYTLLLSAFICAVLFITYFFANRWMPLIAIGSSSAFLLPFVVTQAWYFYRTILNEERETKSVKVGELAAVRKEDALQRKLVHTRSKEIEKPAEIKKQAIIQKEPEESKIQPREKIVNRVVQDGNRKDKIWFYTDPGVDQQPVILLNSVPLYIQLSVKNSGTGEELFTASAPLEMNVGDFFNRFINLAKKNRNVSIDVFDDEQSSFAWKFYAKGLMRIKTENWIRR